MRRAAVLAAALAVAAAGPLAADTRLVAIGDSITAGTSWPVTGMQVEFDCTPSCDWGPSQSDRDGCGYVRRLDDWLGAGYEVRNRGVGGQDTIDALMDFFSELSGQCPGAPGDCAAILLMHGTNDMDNGVSPEMAAFNLGEMVDQAKSWGLDTLLMTIIRKVNEPSDSTWEDYRDEILALAAEKDLDHVDVWAEICISPSCFTQNYWLEDEPPCNHPDGDPDLGHLDPDGYDELTDLIKDAFPAAAPAGPVTTAPTGDIADPTPDYVWAESPGARWYGLQVDPFGTSWWEAAAVCDGGVCTVNPGFGLSEGPQTWRVQGRNLLGVGPASPDTAFHVWAVPGTPAPDQPAGTYFELSPETTPVWEPYGWSEEPDATDYDLEVRDGGGGVVLMQSFDDSICGAGECSAVPGQGLAAGDYTWTVVARNPGAASAASAPRAFEVVDDVPGEATPTGPTGEWFEPYAPLYAWLPAAGAAEYEIEVKDAAENVDVSVTGLAASTHCSGGLCSYPGAVVPDPDDYSLRVRAHNPLGAGPWSAAVADFTILACADDSPRDLAEFVTSGAVGVDTVQYCGPLTAAAAGGFVIEPAGDLTVHTRDGFNGLDGLEIQGKLTVRTP